MEAIELADLLVERGAIPEQSAEDALHVDCEDYARFATFFLDLGATEGRRYVSEDLIRAALEPHG